MAAYNALNQQYRDFASGEAFVGAGNFTSNALGSSGSISGSTSGNRFVILGGKITF